MQLWVTPSRSLLKNEYKKQGLKIIPLKKLNLTERLYTYAPTNILYTLLLNHIHPLYIFVTGNMVVLLALRPSTRYSTQQLNYLNDNVKHYRYEYIFHRVDGDPLFLIRYSNYHSVLYFNESTRQEQSKYIVLYTYIFSLTRKSNARKYFQTALPGKVYHKQRRCDL